jgi:predicted metal-dependent phosphoesterase TrpH
MRCDLHVHSWYSGRAEVPVLEHVGRECYSPPLEVHDRARRRGMDLVTLTDHDTIEGERRFGARHFRAFQEAFGWPALPSEREAGLGAASLGEAA